MGGHVQTIVGSVWANAGPPVAWQRERWTTPDGDFIDVDLLPGEPLQPLWVVFHGLEGNSSSAYIRACAAEAIRRSWAFAAPHFRGCSGDINRMPRAYHSGDYEEIAWILSRLRQQNPGRQLFATGVSLGGNALLRWAQEAQGTAKQMVSSVVAVCAPVDLLASGLALQHGFNRWTYTPYFLKSMKARAAKMAVMHPGLFDAHAVQQAQTLYQFDQHFTAPLHGFSSTHDYWTRASSKKQLKRIQLPTLLIHARNDPFIPASSLPTAQDAGNGVELWQTQQGGHVGYVEGAWPGQLAWLPRCVADWQSTMQ